jgi:hypothetical protein
MYGIKYEVAATAAAATITTEPKTILLFSFILILLKIFSCRNYITDQQKNTSDLLNTVTVAISHNNIFKTVMLKICSATLSVFIKIPPVVTDCSITGGWMDGCK